MHSEINWKTRMKKYSALLILILLLILDVRAQQEPLYTQYNFNTQVINPAYAGTWENLGFMVLGRRQWMGFSGAPQTYNLLIQTPLNNKKVGLGLDVISDKVGREKRFGLFGDYSYGFNVAENSILRLGLKAGFTSYQNDLSRYVQYPGEPDPLIQGEQDVRYMLNFGVGAFLYSEDYYVGLSVPKMIENKFNNNYNNYSAQPEMRHFYLIAGYVKELSEYVDFKPTMLFKAVSGAPVELDLTANFLLNEKVWLGATYRPGTAVGLIAQWIFDNNLRIGYAIDFSTSELQSFHNGSHEVMVSYEISTRTVRKWSSPRRF